MNVASTTPPGCQACGEPVAPGDALVVESIASGRRFLVHRPIGDRFCFRNAVLGVAVHRLVGIFETRDDLHSPADR
jgi:hypothetical protein